MAQCILCIKKQEGGEEAPELTAGRYVRFVWPDGCAFVCFDHAASQLLDALPDDTGMRLVWNPANCKGVSPYKVAVADKYEAIGHFQKCCILAGCRVEKKTGTQRSEAHLAFAGGVLVGDPTEPAVMKRVPWSVLEDMNRTT